MGVVRFAGFAALLLLGSGALAAPTPAAPYYSVDVLTVDTRARAVTALKALGNEPAARVEKRAGGYHVRFGAWNDRASAEQGLARQRARHAGARVIQIEHPVEWITADAGPAPAATSAVSTIGPAPMVLVPVAKPAPRPPAHAGDALPGDLTELSLQELLSVQVTSVSKHAEPLREAAAAIFVLTGDEIRRSGVRSIAEALRMVPGVQVARNSASVTNVTARGFSGDKLEVLLDGRSVYTPLTSTVFWDALDTDLGDIDRIEVIRGPGATLWGANAVNGVINIVTRNARDTLGNQLKAGAGKEQNAFGEFRSGSRIGDSGYGRFYTKAFEVDHSLRNGNDNFDGQRQGQAGFRTDWNLAATQDLTVSGDYYRGVEPSGNLTASARGADTDLTGANLVAQWTQHLAPDSELSVQAYYDGYHRVSPSIFEEKRDTGDVGVQHRFQLGERNTFIYGAGYRASHDDTGGAPAYAIIFNPQTRTLQTWNAFAQDQMKLGQGGELTLGSKFEHNSYTGFEVQPGIRLGWALGEHAYTWGAVSRGVRLPNRIDEDIAIFCSGPVALILGCTVGTTVPVGNPNFQAEKVLAYEWGARYWTSRDFSVDLATFYSHYSDLRSTETTPPPVGSFANETRGNSYGAELSAVWVPWSWLTLRPFYGYLKIDADPTAASTDTFTADNLDGGSPQQSAGLRAAVSPGYNLSIDGFARYVDSVPRQQVPSYTELNLRIGWRPIPSLELAVIGSNLLDPHHPEVGAAPSRTNPAPPPPQVELERGAWVAVTWDWK